jgi:hypothetical protein
MSRAVKPLLVACALLLAGALFSRYPPLAVPDLASSAIAALVGLVLGVVGAAERSLPRGEVGPLWMRLGWPVRLNFALGLSYFTTVFAQQLGLSLGPVDPTFPASAPAAVNTLWFFAFTFGFLGVGMMSAASLMVPLVRVVTLGSKSLLVGALCGLGFTALLVAGVHAPVVTSLIAQGKVWFDANSTLATLALVAIGVVPGLLPSKE